MDSPLSTPELQEPPAGEFHAARWLGSVGLERRAESGESSGLVGVGGVFRCVVADPPWTPSLGATWKTRFTDKARPQKHYATMTVEEICALVPPTPKQAHLWLWVLNQHVDWGYTVARAWGFEVWQMVTWKKPGLGTGQFQCNTESVLVCRKGPRHGNPFGATGGTGFDWPRGRHSEKPDEFFAMVERVSPGPRLEMFARRERPGWVVFGNAIERDLFSLGGGGAELVREDVDGTAEKLPNERRVSDPSQPDT